MGVNVNKYKNSGLAYIKGRLKVLFDNGVAILVEQFDDWDKKNILMAQVLGLANNPEYAGHDWQHAVDTGLLAKKISRKVVPAPEQLPPVPVPSAPPPLQNTAATAPTYRPEPSPITAPVEMPHPVDPEVLPFESEDGLPLESLQDKIARGNVVITDVKIEDPALTPIPEEGVQVTFNFDEDLVKKFTGENVAPLGEDPVGFIGIPSRPAGSFFQRAWAKTWSTVTKSWAKKPVEQKKSSPAAGSIHGSILLILVVIIIVGLGSLVMSAYHIISYMFNGGAGRPFPVAAITGVVMALFSAIAFSATRHFWSIPKISSKIIAFLFAFFGVIVVAFAMFGTVKVNFDAFKEGADGKVAAVVAVSSEIKAATTTEFFVASELKRLDADIASFKAKAEDQQRRWQAQVNLGEEGNANLKWQYWTEYQKADKAMKAAQDERKPYATKNLTASTDVVAAETKVKQTFDDGTLFGMLSRLFGLDIDLVQFIVYAIPAVFYDLMSPFALTVAMLLIDERALEKRKREEE